MSVLAALELAFTIAGGLDTVIKLLNDAQAGGKTELGQEVIAKIKEICPDFHIALISHGLAPSEPGLPDPYAGA